MTGDYNNAPPPVQTEGGARDDAGAKSTESIASGATITNPLDASIDRYADARGTTAVERPTMRQVLKRIRTGVDDVAVRRCRLIRERDGEEAYRKEKQKLTAYTFAGTFTARNADKLISHSGCVVLDLDHLEDLAEARQRIVEDAHVLFAFVSPSGEGLKVGLRVEPSADKAEHTSAWHAAAAYARAAWGIDADKSGKDVSRLCFTSADPDLFINEHAIMLEAHCARADFGANDQQHERGFNTRKNDADKARAALARLASMRADDYEDWLRVGMALKDAGCALEDWDTWSRQSAKYKPGECAKKWESFKGSGLTVATLIQMANEDAPPAARRATVADPDLTEGSELWFAREIVRDHGNDLKYVKPWKSWMVWKPDEGRWERDVTGAHWRAAKSTLKRLLNEAADGDDQKLLKALSSFTRKSPIESALKLAQSEPAVVARVEDWDVNPYLLNCLNGTVDLRDGKLREHRRDDRLTKTTGVAFGGECPRWHAFLERIIPDPDVRTYLQRAVGYSALGLVTEPDLFIAWGVGANGKSVYFNAISYALGDFATPVPGALLVGDGTREHPTLLATLHGVRFAVASETEEGGRIRAAQLKQLTGGDKLIARRMREDFWKFKPSHTLWLQTNHKPQTREATHGFWRRVRLIPFTVTIPVKEQDKHLTATLRDEAGGILQWIVEGAAQYLTEGLEPPEAVVAATDEYKDEQDELADFMESVGLVADERAFISTADLYKMYREWADGAVQKPWGRRTLTSRLQGRGLNYTNKPKRGFRARIG